MEELYYNGHFFSFVVVVVVVVDCNYLYEFFESFELKDTHSLDKIIVVVVSGDLLSLYSIRCLLFGWRSRE
jgi:hypothetical protein